MNIFDSLKDQAEAVAAKLGVPVDQAQQMLASLAEKAQAGGGDIAQSLQETAAKFGVSPEKLSSLTGADGPLGGLMSKLGNPADLLKGLDKDGDGNPLNDIADTVKGFFGGKK